MQQVQLFFYLRYFTWESKIPLMQLTAIEFFNK